MFVLRTYASKYAPEQTWCGWTKHTRLERDILTLQKQYLVRRSIKDSALEMDISLQSHIQAWLSSNDKLACWERTCLELIAEAFPTGEFENWARCEQLLPHIAVVYDSDLIDKQTNESRAHITTRLAWYFWKKGSLKCAEENIKMAIELRIKRFGVTHRQTLCSMEILAGILMSQGHCEQAEMIHRLVLEELERIFDSHHPKVLMSVSNLALVLLQQHRYSEAEALTRHTLEHSKSDTTADRIETLTTLSNLALVLHAQKRYIEAESCSRRALEGFRAVCGKRHPNILTNMTNLAVIYREQGKFQEAERLLRQSLRWKLEKLGPDHPSTLTSDHNLADLTRIQRENPEASINNQQEAWRWSGKVRKRPFGIARLKPRLLDLLQHAKNFTKSRKVGHGL